MRALFFLFVALLAFPGSVKAEFRTVFSNARVESLDPKTKTITIVVESKVKSRDATPVRHEGVVTEEDMRRELATGRKVKATFANLKTGQRVKVTMLWARGLTSPTWATNLVILNTKER